MIQYKITKYSFISAIWRFWPLLLTCLILPTGFGLRAAHLIGGEMTYECLGNDQYKIILKLYRDCNCNMCAEFDNVARTGIYFSRTTNLVGGNAVSLLRSGDIDTIPVGVDNPCLAAPPDVCVSQIVYERTVELPQSPWGYDVVYQRCCRIPGITNIINSGSNGATYWVHIPGSTEAPPCNSSPVFRTDPPAVLCINDNLNFDYSAVDPDGDSLVYELCRPYIGASSMDPDPDPPEPPPFNNIGWETGYSDGFQMDANPPLEIHPETGIMTGSPSQAGIYVVGVCVKEYRDGQFLGQIYKDFHFNVVNTCIPQVPTAIADQQTQCDGLTVIFENNSTGAQSFFWDFGDPSTNEDTSSLESPTYTYNNSGTYVITLIANPGFSCADTATNTFTVSPILFPAYEPPANQCLVGNSFDFQAGGFFNPDVANFLWDFGPNAAPMTSTDRDPSDIVFSNQGWQRVALSIAQDDCERNYQDSILVNPNPIADFGVDVPDGCEPLTVNLNNQSIASDNITFQWDLGGISSDEENPVLTLSAGTYDVSLLVANDSGCTSELTRTDYIVVYPSPNANFSLSSQEVLFSNPEVALIDNSMGGNQCEYWVDEDVIEDCNSNYVFLSPGSYEVTQIVTDENGCSDTLTKTVLVVDDRDFSVSLPNTITPNGDGANDTWRIEGIEAHPNNELNIFTRSGRHVFNAQPYQNEQPWDGTWDGNELPAGVYFYQLIKLDHGEGSKSGLIHIIRDNR